MRRTAAPRHNRRVPKPIVPTIVLALLFAGAGLAPAGDIYRWTDADGRTHFSNRGADVADEPSVAPSYDSGDEGWESVLERQQGSGSFQEKAEASINSLELQVMRKKRERNQAKDELDATQAGIVQAQTVDSPNLPALRAREATEIANLQKIDVELGKLRSAIAKMRAMKTADRDQRSAR